MQDINSNVVKKSSIVKRVGIVFAIFIILVGVVAFVIIPFVQTDSKEGVGIWGDAPVIGWAVQIAYKIKCERDGGEVFEIAEKNYCGIGKTQDAYKKCSSSTECEIFCGFEGGFITHDAAFCVPYQKGWVGVKYEDYL
ncbi:MAG: hypothetical protein WCV85_01885 [Patescibacteria group bacterium]|jgi:hypothetical protein